MGIFNRISSRGLFKKPGIYDGLKPYTVNTADDEGGIEVNLYGGIVSRHPVDWWTGEKVDGLFIALDDFIDDLDRLSTAKSIRFNINSVGGEVDAGIAIYNKIRNLSENGISVATRVEGAADSAAAIVAQAGDTREVAIGSEMMVHCASCLLFDYYDSKGLDAVKSMLDATDQRIAELLADCSRRSLDEVKRMMRRTTWMTAEDAIKEGFADELVNARVSIEAVAGMKDALSFNGVPHIFRGIPMPFAKAVAAGIPASEIKVEPPGDDPALHIDNENSTKGGTKMTRQELEDKYPEIVNEIRDEATKESKTCLDGAVDSAVKAERERIRAIEEIEHTIADKALIHAAKYEKPVNAAELALAALQSQAKTASAREDAREKELQESGVYGVEPDPVDGSDAENRRRDVADGAALIAGIAKEVK